MKNIKYLLSLFLLTTMLGCSEDDKVDGILDGVEAPRNISALMTITQDNTGMVTIRPDSEGATSYEIQFGDGSESETIAPGEVATHAYAEGTYNVTIVATGLTGLQTTYSQPLTVSFVAPQNLTVDITPQPGNPFMINVSAEADLATYFQVWLGEDPSETPVQFNEGQTVSHTYTATGTYEVRVVAYSGGAATTEYTEMVTIFDPLLLPVDFESATLNYAFGDFGGAFTSVVNNPEPDAVNPSPKVAKLTKTAGAEVWAGVTLLLDEPINFTGMPIITIRSYSPVAGATILFKLENATNAGVFVERTAVTTVANQWETLTFDLTGVNNGNNYQRLVMFYDFGNNGTGAEYYFDDIEQSAGGAQLELPLTFENSALTYSFGNFGGANATVVNNPHATGINTSSKVGQLIKNAGSEVWAGTAITLDSPIDFSVLKKVKVKVWSPQAGIVVLLKLENSSNTTINTELPATTTVANGWEELTYDFTGINNSNNYQNVVLFFDFGVNGTGATYYFDDIRLSN
ncbi:MAG TPA: PKD domain-containing protein [Flavobacterium sp.]|jgi:hypothetical protein